MAVKMRRKEEEGAPAYMTQFTALMTILLAFFICMLTLGQQKTAQYKKGFGQIRNAFGVRGGQGLLDFWRKLRDRNPNVDVGETGEDARLRGFRRGDFSRTRFDRSRHVRTEIERRGSLVHIRTPVSFPEGACTLTAESRRFLDDAGGVLYGLPEYAVDVMHCCAPADGGDGETLAARRSAAVVRYLRDHCGIADHRLRAIGYADGRYLDAAAAGGSGGLTVIAVRRMPEHAAQATQRAQRAERTEGRHG